MSELHDQLARVKLHKGLAPLTCIVSRQQFTGVRPLFQTFPARAVFQPNVPANQRRVLQEALVNGGNGFAWAGSAWDVGRARSVLLPSSKNRANNFVGARRGFTAIGSDSCGTGWQP